MAKGTRVASIMSLAEFSDDDFLVMLTKDGLIKRTPLKDFSKIHGSLIAIKLRVCVLSENTSLLHKTISSLKRLVAIGE